MNKYIKDKKHSQVISARVPVLLLKEFAKYQTLIGTNSSNPNLHLSISTVVTVALKDAIEEAKNVLNK